MSDTTTGSAAERAAEGSKVGAGDNRGVLYPARLPEFHRERATAVLEDFVRWFWIPEWNLQEGRVSRQHIIGFAACNLVVERNQVSLTGPTTRAGHRDLSGTGWAVGALLRPAAVLAFTDHVTALRDNACVIDAPELATAVATAMDAATSGTERRRAAIVEFSRWLRERCGEPSDEGLIANRMVDIVETDATMTQVGDIAKALHLSTRSVQRLAATYVGLSPSALIRRRRLQEGVEFVRTHPGTNLTDLAQTLGYVDHAHLTNEWRTVLGFTPSTYRTTEDSHTTHE